MDSVLTFLKDNTDLQIAFFLLFSLVSTNFALSVYCLVIGSYKISQSNVYKKINTISINLNYLTMVIFVFFMFYSVLPLVLTGDNQNFDQKLIVFIVGCIMTTTLGLLWAVVVHFEYFRKQALLDELSCFLEEVYKLETTLYVFNMVCSCLAAWILMWCRTTKGCGLAPEENKIKVKTKKQKTKNKS